LATQALDPDQALIQPDAGAVVSNGVQPTESNEAWMPFSRRSRRGGRLGRYFVDLFLFVWLCGWFAGIWVALSKLISEGLSLFEAAWLAFWISGGAIVMFVLHALLRPYR
jgi:hypothetical protein